MTGGAAAPPFFVGFSEDRTATTAKPGVPLKHDARFRFSPMSAFAGMTIGYGP